MLNVQIENMFYSQKNFQNIDLIKVHEFLQNNELFHVDYNVELFAGMYLIPKYKKISYNNILSHWFIHHNGGKAIEDSKRMRNLC